MRKAGTAVAYLWASPLGGSYHRAGASVGRSERPSGGTIHVVSGVIEAHGGFATWFLRYVTGIAPTGGAAAMTLGHVVIGSNRYSLDRTRAHERAHVEQCELWGPLFVLAYLLASAFAWVQGKDSYRDNWFEREALDSLTERLDGTQPG